MADHKAEVIDVHAHVVLSETLMAAGAYGPEIGAAEDGTPWFRIGAYRLNGVAYLGSPFMDFDLRIQRMDAAGITHQALSPNPLTYFHHIPAGDAIRYCRIHNDALARHLAAYRTRLSGMAALPMQDIGAACEELHRAVSDLGLLGGYIGVDLPQRLHAQEMDRFYQTCVDLDVPLFLHPSPAGIDSPPAYPPLDEFELDVVFGFAASETVAVANLIFGQVLERHPGLDICISHGGGASAYLIGRMSRAARKRKWAPESLRADGAFEEAYAKLWFDDHLNSDASLVLLRSIVGDDRLVYGTNFAGWDAPDAGSGHLPSSKLAQNARTLLRLKGN